MLLQKISGFLKKNKKKVTYSFAFLCTIALTITLTLKFKLSLNYEEKINKNILSITNTKNENKELILHLTKKIEFNDEDKKLLIKYITLAIDTHVKTVNDYEGFLKTLLEIQIKNLDIKENEKINIMIKEIQQKINTSKYDMNAMYSNLFSIYNETYND